MDIRTTDNPTWISEICREFALASGWPVQFAATGGNGMESLKAELENSGECCWSAEIGCG
ncbi:MAG: hypothetical protein IID45_03905, partial [Planctomycetes bacterium]|nr:hypothetical protein [Planctomycetota bacterium]